MAYQVPRVPYLRLKFHLAARQDCRLPTIKGSMLRGAFGNALKRTVCVMEPQQSCQVCMLRQQCVYTRIFETFIEAKPPPFLKGLQTAPRPFILDPFDTKTAFAEGDEFAFELRLFGRICELYPYIIFSVMHLAETGLGASRFAFQLTRVNWIPSAPNGAACEEEKLLYTAETNTLLESACPSVGLPEPKPSTPVTLSFLTPTRLRFLDKYTTEFSFRMLVFKMLRRALEIAYFYVPNAEPNWEFRDYLKLADQVHIVRRSLRWQDWHRYSNRQKAKMELGGFVGEIVLNGKIEPFNELLQISQILHVGKGTGFGLGKVGIVELKSA